MDFKTPPSRQPTSQQPHSPAPPSPTGQQYRSYQGYPHSQPQTPTQPQVQPHSYPQPQNNAWQQNPVQQPTTPQPQPVPTDQTDRRFSSGIPQGPTSTANQTEPSQNNPKKPKKKSKKAITAVLAVVGLIVILIAATVGWYLLALRPVDPQAESKEFVVADGSTPSMIGDSLKGDNLIRSSWAFLINSRLQGVQGSLQAGTYSLSPASSTEEIISALVKGPSIQTVDITFLPGATLSDHRSELINAGYTEDQIDQAFLKNYEHPLFATKPDAADLEGYIYGETHRFDRGVPLDKVLTRYFDDFYKVIQENNLAQKYEQQGLTLFEGITLASIIEREVSCGSEQICEDQRKVAQVFFKRLNEDISLGADATFVYAARKAGEAPTVDFDSPYNTRIYKGLPPGPISTPGVGALLAVADPADGDYLFFVSGDDGVNYFSRTEEEHIANTRKYCDVNCRLPQ